MITTLAAVLLGSISSAAMQGLAPGAPLSPAASAPASPAPAVHASSAAAPASAASVLGFSTYTVSTLYTGDKVRDPFLPPAMGGAALPRERDSRFAVDIHALELRGIMKDGRSDFAIFSEATGETFILRGSVLYDGRSKRVPGISGLIMMKRKRAELITADKDVQIYTLGQPDANKAKSAQPDDAQETGSGRSP